MNHFMILRRTVAALPAAAMAFALALSPALSEETDGALAKDAKIVAIGGSITEIIYALGQEKRLVARDSTSVFPQAALALPDVGYMRQLSPEGVLSVGPEGIIALEGSGPREAVDVLKKASVPIVMVPESFDRDGILAKIQTVGRALGEPEAAARLSASVAADIEAAQALTEAMTTRKRVLFILSLQGGKVMASGSGIAADGVIAMAGGVNAIEGFSGYKQLTDEAIITARPDVILLMDRGQSLDITRDEIGAHPALSATPAGAAKAVVKMDGAYLLGFGPRTAGAIRELAAALYGDKTRS